MKHLALSSFLFSDSDCLTGYVNSWRRVCLSCLGRAARTTLLCVVHTRVTVTSPGTATGREAWALHISVISGGLRFCRVSSWPIITLFRDRVFLKRNPKQQILPSVCYASAAKCTLTHLVQMPVPCWATQATHAVEKSIQEIHDGILMKTCQASKAMLPPSIPEYLFRNFRGESIICSVEAHLRKLVFIALKFQRRKSLNTVWQLLACLCVFNIRSKLACLQSR